MSDINIGIPVGEKKRLLTGGKYCPDDIVVEAVGGVPAVEEKDVNFYDYDGTLLHSYTLAEVQEMSELPPLPSQPGLICQGWNWSLEDLQAYAKPYDVMPFYITEDGATWYDIENDTGRDFSVTFRWRPLGGTVSLDFGDGSEMYTDTSTTAGSTAEITHVYAPGKYRAKLSGAYNLGGNNAVSDVDINCSMLLRKVFFGEYPSDLLDYAFRNCKKLCVCTVTGDTRTTGAQVFNSCSNLRSMVISRGRASDYMLASSILLGCASLKVLSLSNEIKKWHGVSSARSIERVCLPDGIVFGGGGLADDEALQYVNLPSRIDTLPPNLFLRCASLARITVPENVVSIGANAFGNCSGLVVLRFLPTTPPTVANANAFTGIPASCVVEVPAGTLAAYQAATNYAAIAAQMAEVGT